MLEFNENHKKIDLSHVNVNSVGHKKNGKVMLAGILLSAVILFSGCGKKVDKNSNTDLNRAMISIGSEYFVIDINKYTPWSYTVTELTLTDGTQLSIHPSDLQLYNNKSETMQNIEESLGAINTYNENYYVEDSEKLEYDRAFVQTGDSIITLKISKYTLWDNSVTELTLEDGTTLCVHPMNLTLFNSKSLVMAQIEVQILNSEKVKTR